jgi:hypothetical protein
MTSEPFYILLLYVYIYVSMYQFSYPSTCDTSALAAGRAWEQIKVYMKMMVE